MALLRVNAVGVVPVLHGRDGADLRIALGRALVRPGPVTILLHGYRYRPGTVNCPHRHIFALRRDVGVGRCASWPRFLHGAGAPGVLICFGWDAGGRLGRAYRMAGEAGRALAVLVDMIAALDGARKVHVLAHSMGARVGLQALHFVDAGRLSRLILMAAAEFVRPARAALASPAGRFAEVVHVTGRENRLFDWLLAAGLPRGDRVLGVRALAADNMRTVLLDDGATLRALAGLGFPIGPPQRRVCHWSPYLRPGVFDFYRALLSGVLEFGELDAALVKC